MNLAKQKMEELIEALKTSNEYTQYQSYLLRIKSQPELCERIKDYRKQSIAVQMRGGEEFIQGNNDLQKNFSDLLKNGLVVEFFAAEHKYCNMVKKLQETFLEGANIDTSFME